MREGEDSVEATDSRTASADSESIDTEFWRGYRAGARDCRGSVDRMDALEAQRNALATAAKVIVDGFAQQIFIRDTSRDSEPGGPCDCCHICEP